MTIDDVTAPWEVLLSREAEGQKIDVCWFSYRTASLQGIMCLMAMCNEMIARQKDLNVRLLMYGNSLIHKARNRALAETRPGSHVLMVDDDMAFQPSDGLTLIRRNLPVVSGLATNRRPPLWIIPKIWNERELGYERCEDLIDMRGIVQGEFAVGGAFLFLSRETIDAVVKQYLTAADWAADNKAMFDRMGIGHMVRNRERQRRADLREKQFKEKNLLRVFTHSVNDHEMELSEDISFSDRLRYLKIPVAIDGSVRIGHLGEYPFGVWDITNRMELREQIAGGGFDPRQYMSESVREFFGRYMEAA